MVEVTCGGVRGPAAAARVVDGVARSAPAAYRCEERRRCNCKIRTSAAVSPAVCAEIAYRIQAALRREM